LLIEKTFRDIDKIDAARRPICPSREKIRVQSVAKLPFPSVKSVQSVAKILFWLFPIPAVAAGILPAVAGGIPAARPFVQCPSETGMNGWKACRCVPLFPA
jgi:hypothetical protein